MLNNNNSVQELSNKFLLDKNIIDLYGVIDDNLACVIISQLQYLDYRFIENNVHIDDRIITLQINSPGGSVTAGLAIYDTMNYISSKVCTVGIGCTASMGAFLLASGTKGYRKALPHCEVILHQPLGGVKGQASDIIIAAQHITRVRQTLNTILSENTNNSIEKVALDTDRDYIMTAKEALEYGIIDEIIATKSAK